MILIDIFSGPIFLQIGWLWVQILLRRDKTAGASAERACGHLVRCWGGISVLRGRRLLQSRVVRQLPGGGRDRWVCQGGWGLHLPGRLQRQATTTLWQVRLNKFWIKKKCFCFKIFQLTTLHQWEWPLWTRCYCGRIRHWHVSYRQTQLLFDFSFHFQWWLGFLED